MARDWTTPEAWTDSKAISTARLNAISTQLTWLYEMMFAIALGDESWYASKVKSTE